jgi:F-type H+-transporting ATPase subunit delta
MSVLKSSLPYAKALFESANEAKIGQEVKNDVLAILNVCKQSEEFNLLIKDPTINSIKKNELIDRLFNTKINDLTLNFIKLLSNKRRIGQLENIFQGFLDHYNKFNNIVALNITTAVSISDDMMNQIASKIIKDVHVETKNIVNPSIIGGFIAEFDQKMLDESIATKLNKLKQKFNS